MDILKDIAEKYKMSKKDYDWLKMILDSKTEMETLIQKIKELQKKGEK